MVTRHCFLCQQPGQRESICPGCLQDFPRTRNACRYCGQQVHAPNQQTCGKCLSNPPAFRLAVSAFDYDFPVKQIVRQLKYRDRGHWAKPLARAAFAEFDKAYGGLSQALLVPVPMHSSQYQQRRDNHAELICRQLSKLSGYPMNGKLIAKTKATTRQAELSAAARRTNVRGSFSLLQQVPAMPVILVDDVVTTGSTLDALARLLIKGGASEVYGFSIARKSLD